LAGFNCEKFQRHIAYSLAYNNSELIMTAKMYVVVAPPLMVEEIDSFKKNAEVSIV
jgi:hypothetical protein